MKNRAGIIAGYIARDYKDEQYFKRYVERKKVLEKNANKKSQTVDTDTEKQEKCTNKEAKQ